MSDKISQGFGEEQASNHVAGRNPVRELLQSGRDVEKLLVAKGDVSTPLRELMRMAKERRIPVQEVDKRRLDELAERHQGVIAVASAMEYKEVSHMLARAAEQDKPPFLIALDGIMDPHNLGAIIRTAECAGAHGVLIPRRRAVGLTPAAVRASAGGAEYMPVAKVANMARELEDLKKQGFWVVGADASGQPMDKIDWTGPLVLVIGGEGGGISRLVLEKCDFVAAIPMHGHLSSLNASVAAAVLMYEALRHRG